MLIRNAPTMTGYASRKILPLLVGLLAGASCSGDVPGREVVHPTPAESAPPTIVPLVPPRQAPPPSSPAAPTLPVISPTPSEAAILTEAGLLVVSPAGLGLAARPGGPQVGRLRGGVALPIDAVAGGWARVLTPCERRAWAPLNGGATTSRATVVLDPGHGGSELGAVGPGGLAEKGINLDVARRTSERLRAQGIDAVLTRGGDYRATLAFRVSLAASVHPAVFVSIHHNADPDGPRDRPGTETYYQFRSASSRRLSGLLYEEISATLAGFPAQWVGDTDAGAKWRLNDGGGDYYGILRRAGGANIVASLAEMAFVSNPSEEALLRRDDVRQAEADATARAIIRFLGTDDPGSGFTVPYPRTAPAGPGGGRTGCVDPS